MNEDLLMTKALKERLSGRPNKNLTLAVACEAMADTGLLESLFSILYGDSCPLQWRVAWVLEKVSRQHPSMLVKERDRIGELAMCADVSDGLRRLLLSILYNMPDAQEVNVKLYNFLLDVMIDFKSASGVQALAMKLARRISYVNKDLHEEFLCVVRNMELEYYSAGVRSVVRHCVKNR